MPDPVRRRFIATVIDRRDHHFGKTTIGAVYLLAPPVDLSGANLGALGDIGDNRSRRKGRSHDGPLLRLIPRRSRPVIISMLAISMSLHQCKHRRLHQCDIRF
jgi:hypothetical protein